MRDISIRLYEFSLDVQRPTTLLPKLSAYVVPQANNVARSHVVAIDMERALIVFIHLDTCEVEIGLVLPHPTNQEIRKFRPRDAILTRTYTFEIGFDCANAHAVLLILGVQFCVQPQRLLANSAFSSSFQLRASGSEKQVREL